MKRTLLLIVVCGLSLAALAASPPPKAKPNGPKPARDGARFLFVVDTSASMKSIDPGTRQTVFDLIFSGIDGYMRTGDTFGVWTFNEEIGAGRYPMKVWDAENPLELAGQVTMFVREQERLGDNRIEELMMKLTGIIRATTNLNVLLISDGDTKMQGTPMDREINSAYSQRNKERKAAKKPFITTLIVEGGKIVNGFVILPGEPVNLPARPAPAQASARPVTSTTLNAAATPPVLVTIAPRQAASTASNPPATAISSLPATTAPKPDLAPSKPQSHGSETVPTAPSANVATEDHSQGPDRTAEATVATPPRKVMQIITLPSRPAAKPEEPTNAPVAADANSGPPPVAATLVPATPPQISTPPPPLAAVSAEPVSQVTAAKPIEPVRETMLRAVVAPTPIVVAAREPTSVAPEKAPSMMSAVQVRARPELGAMPTLIIGGILLAMALFLLGIALRRMRHEPQGSLITQSMHRR